LKTLQVDTETLDAVCLCEKCGSRRIVTSVHYLNKPDVINGRLVLAQYVCKPCYNDMLQLDPRHEVMFGHEGFLDENLTIYDLQEIGEQHEKLNERFRIMGCRTRFKLWQEPFVSYQMHLTIYRNEYQKIAAIREAETTMRLLCKGKMRFRKVSER